MSPERAQVPKKTPPSLLVPTAFSFIFLMLRNEKDTASQDESANPSITTVGSCQPFLPLPNHTFFSSASQTPKNLRCNFPSPKKFQREPKKTRNKKSENCDMIYLLSTFALDMTVSPHNHHTKKKKKKKRKTILNIPDPISYFSRRLQKAMLVPPRNSILTPVGKFSCLTRSRAHAEEGIILGGGGGWGIYLRRGGGELVER